MPNCLICGSYAVEFEISPKKIVIDCPNGHKYTLVGYHGGRRGYGAATPTTPRPHRSRRSRRGTPRGGWLYGKAIPPSEEEEE